MVVELPDGDGEALAAALSDALGGSADLVLDPVFGWVAEAALRVLAPAGRLVNLGGSAGDAASFSSAALRGTGLSVLGYTNNSLTPEQRADALRAVLGHAAGGRISVAHEVRPLADVAEVWTSIVDRSVTSRQVLVP